MSSPPGSQHGPTPAVCPPAATLHTIAGGRPTPSTHFSPQVLAGTPVRDVRRSCHEVPFDQVEPPHFTAQYRVPPQWPTAARDRGEVPANVATRPLSDGRRRFHRTTQMSWIQREFGPARSLTE
ncbi:DUF5949 family protein [Streptomyces sp. NPDC056663]|uniref:DUF5949 family protein n=1 Tax=Streptomyces sp. NPDC056663 TaxID=3345899 RepID=UPI0036C12E62